MTDYDPELEALLARQADEVRQFVERARAADAQKLALLARRVIAAMGLDMDDVIAALGLSGTAANVSDASGSFGSSGILAETAANISTASGGAGAQAPGAWHRQVGNRRDRGYRRAGRHGCARRRYGMDL